MSKYAKFYAAAVAALAVIASSAIFTGRTQEYLNVAISVLGAVAVYLFPNGTPTPKGRARKASSVKPYHDSE